MQNNPNAREVQHTTDAAAAAFTDKQLTLFAARCRELADRVAAGQIKFIDAIDMAYSAAIWSGLVDHVGDDAVQHVMALCFRSAHGATA
jgi:hypothetical protein